MLFINIDFMQMNEFRMQKFKNSDGAIGQFLIYGNVVDSFELII